jgi:anti-sigma factor ChrR (cupin superfamily)
MKSCVARHRNATMWNVAAHFDGGAVARQTECLNGNMTISVVMDTRKMDWSPSPAGTVLRKRLHLVGEVESGQVTSLVRYLPGSSFPEHGHPEGEEIFVVTGTFSDHVGDAHKGTHLLNPEGFRHAPHSDPGCVILVKLRQYGGEGRGFHRIRTRELTWSATELRGIERKTLYRDDRFPDVTRLERWAPGAKPGQRVFPGGAEFFVIEGAFEDAERRFPAGTWMRLPAGATLEARSENGCVTYVKTGAVATLRSA